MAFWRNNEHELGASVEHHEVPMSLAVVLPEFVMRRLVLMSIGVPVGALAMWAFHAARTEKASRSLRGELVLQASRPVRLVAVAGLFMPVLVLLLMLVFPPKQKDMVPALGCFIMFAVLGYGLHWMIRRTTCVAGEQGLRMPSIWTRRRFYEWSQIARVEFNLGSTAIMFYTADGRKWDIPRVLAGHLELLELARRHVAPELFTDMGIAAPNPLQIGINPGGSMAKSVEIAREVERKRMKAIDIKVNCPKCGQALAIEQSAGGAIVDCPTCSQPLVVPRR